MATFRVGLTRDFLNPEGELNFDIGLDVLSRHPNVKYEFFTTSSEEVLPEQIRDYDAVIALSPRWTRATFAESPRLIVVARCGVGFDNVDLKACTDANVLCLITPEGVRRPVAMAILTYITTLSMRVLIKDRLVRENRWHEKTNHMGLGLTGKVVGSVGLGGIAREFFTITKPLGLTGLAYDPFVPAAVASQYDVRLVELETLLRESDYICINCPLNDDTFHLIGAPQLDLMKATAFLINTARGAVVDETALLQALQERRIQGAGLDTFEQEPLPAHHPLTMLDNVVLAPHGLAWTDEIFRNNGLEDIRGLLQVAQGLVPNHVVNRDVLEKPEFQAKLARYRHQ